MNGWTRAAIRTRCGRCNHLIPDGAPRQVLLVGLLERAKVRCALCADGPVPHDVPDTPPRAPLPPTGGLTPVRQLAGLPLDWSRRAVGDRTPGEEG